MKRGEKMPEAQRAKLRAAKIGKKLTPEHRAKISAATRGKPKTKEHIAKIRLAKITRALVEQHPEKLPDYVRERRRHLKRHYGITEEDFSAMLEKQGSRCGICNGTEHRSINWHVDHCHASGKVRGLLCVKCNWLLGAVGDNVETLRAAAAYVERHSC